MADACEEGTLPDILAHITTKSQLHQLRIFHCGQWRDSEIQSFFDDRNGYNTDSIKRLAKAKLTNVKRVKQAITALQSLSQPEPVNLIQQQIKNLEFDLIGTKIPYYFPTPKNICDRLIELALLETGMKVLEPCAGKGDLAQVIREAVNVNLDVCELNYDLREILKLKGFNLIANDCFQLTYPQWHRIIANPPFGKTLELDHIYHYYNILLKGGRMVAIVPESVECSTKKVYQLFRQWLTDKCYLNEPLPDGAFLHSDRPTGVKTRILVIEKD
jgi:methylase of polypeptide subunit release factors